jgi:hypothetical protein
VLNAIFRRAKPLPYLAMAEYWVYLDSPEAPSQDDIMTRMIQSNPYSKPGVQPIGTKEGLLWSDVRFHMALARRDKNAHIFRPDLFESHVEPTPELLEALGQAQSLLKLRYVSETRLPDPRHLQFLVYAAEAAAHLAGSRAIFDLVGEKLLCPKWLGDRLHENHDGARKEFHLRVIWRGTERGGTAETRGLAKVGLPELCTPETMEDHRVVAVQVLQSVAERFWDEGTIHEQCCADLYGDRFHVVVSRRKKGAWCAKILREAGCGQSE